MKKSCLGLCILLLFSGCSQQPESGATAKEIAYGLLGPGPANYEELQEHRSYNGPGFQNTSTSFRTMETDRSTLTNDQERIRSILQDDHKLKTGMIWMAGSHVWVNVTLPEQLSKKKKEQLMDEVRADLKRGIPRYQVHLEENSQ